MDAAVDLRLSDTILLFFETLNLQEKKRILYRKSVTMRLSYIIISLTFSSISLLFISAEITFDNSNNNIDWNSTDGFTNLAISDPNILDDQEADPFLNFDLFSDAGSEDNLASGEPNTASLEDDFFSPPDSLIAAGIDDKAAVVSSCLSLGIDDHLQARSPTQCPNPLESPDSGSSPTRSTIANPNDFTMDGFTAKPLKFHPDLANPRLCPPETFIYRYIPLCDSGSRDDIRQRDADDGTVYIDLINPTICAYDFITAPSVSHRVYMFLLLERALLVWINREVCHQRKLNIKSNSKYECCQTDPKSKNLSVVTYY